MITAEMLSRERKACAIAEVLKGAHITAALIREFPPTPEQWEAICFHAHVNHKRLPSDKTIARVLEILDGVEPGPQPIVWTEENEECPF